MRPDFIFGITPGDYYYDIESYPNVFTITFRNDNHKWVFVISDWQNDLQPFVLFMETLRSNKCRGIGFNNLGYDYPIIHHIYINRRAHLTAADIYQKSMAILNADRQSRFSHMVWESDWVFSQIDLYKVHHFDNMAKATSLKVIEFNLRMPNLENTPFPFGSTLTKGQVPVLLEYNDNDVVSTEEFATKSQAAIKMRESLSQKFNVNMMNMSDVKIGETILVHGLEERGIQCYYKDANGRKQKKQTPRDSVNLAEVILPYIRFDDPGFNRILNFFKSKTIRGTKGEFSDLVTPFNGIEFKFGTGGLHASVEATVVKSNETHQLVDVDVASFYPNLAIVNNFYPEHLGHEFCDAYLDLYHTRKTFKKGTPENEAYKLALNGAYGGSNNDYSPFLDPKYTMSITINGQLLLAMLSDELAKTPGLRMIQANTDGVTCLCPRGYLSHLRAICTWWEGLTGLTLEAVNYRKMMIRDVNSYIAEKEDGSLKRIGAYAHLTAEEKPGTRELPYHKDWSARVVAKAAEAALVRGEDIRTVITNHDDWYDFLLRTKVPRAARLEWGGEPVPNTIRYFISTDGDYLEKVMEPSEPIGEFKRANGINEIQYKRILQEIGPGVWDTRIHTKNQSTYEVRRSYLHSGYTVRICNRLSGRPDSINYDWYVKEAEALVLPLVHQ